jgi:pimeloyl-ACP methyl ester carboxylesterase
MASYILIHGAWHGGWCWEKVAGLLRAQGHEVQVPDLPGHGDNAKPFAEVKLQDYLDGVMAVVKTCTHPPILVGHSFAGMLLTSLAANFPGQFSRLIYVAAYVPYSGDSLLSLSEKFSATGLSPELVVDKKNHQLRLKTENLDKLLYNCATPTAQSWAIAQVSAEPLAPLATAVKFSDFNYASVDTLYILCGYDEAIRRVDQQWLAERTQGSVVSLPSDHCPFLSMPEKLAWLLMEG